MATEQPAEESGQADDAVRGRTGPWGVRVPDDDAQEHLCRYCNHPFPTDEQVTLHKGLEHPERLDDAEETAFRAAYQDEREELQRFKIIALGVLVLLYFGLMIAYALIA